MRCAVDLEGHGGLYTLHSHLNHSCRPNVSIRHLDQRTALARVTVLAKTDIKAGQELIVTYVNPELHLKARRAALEAWGFGECRCERCAEEEIKFGKAAKLEKKDDIDDLEKELKAGLGVMWCNVIYMRVYSYSRVLGYV